MLKRDYHLMYFSRNLIINSLNRIIGKLTEANLTFADNLAKATMTYCEDDSAEELE